MCLGEVGRVVALLDERSVVVECAGRETTALLDVVLAEGTQVRRGDVVVVSMGLVLSVVDESEVSGSGGPVREEVRR